MRFNELYNVLHRVPFHAFRIQLTNGQSYTIRHPDSAWLKRTSILIGLSSGKNDIPDEHTECDLLHVVSVEPANGLKRQKRGAAQKASATVMLRKAACRR